MSARRDDEMKQELEGRLRSDHPTRADESLDAEPPADDDPVLADDPTPGVGSEPSRQSQTEALRLDLAKHLDRRSFPCDRTVLAEELRHAHAPDQLIDAVERLPAGHTFTDVQDVVTSLDEP